MFKWSAAAALLVVVADVPPLTSADLISAAANYDKAPVDKFTPRPTFANLIGRPIRATVKFIELTDAGGPRVGRSGGWTYNADSGELKLTPWVADVDGYELASDPNLHDVKKRFYGFVIRANAKYLGKQTMGNASGAIINVDQYLGTSLVVGAFIDTFEKPAPFPATSEDWTATIKMAPAEARETTEHLRFFVEGTVSPYADQHVIACGDTGSIATFDRRSERLLRQCVVSATITRFGVEDDRTGKVLADWRAT